MEVPLGKENTDTVSFSQHEKKFSQGWNVIVHSLKINSVSQFSMGTDFWVFTYTLSRFYEPHNLWPIEKFLPPVLHKMLLKFLIMMKIEQPNLEHWFCVFQSHVMETNRAHLRDVLPAQWWHKDFPAPRAHSTPWGTGPGGIPAVPALTAQTRLSSTHSFSTLSLPHCIISKELYLFLCLDMKVPALRALFSLSSFLCHRTPRSDPVYCKSLHTSLSRQRKKNIAISYGYLWVFITSLLCCYQLDYLGHLPLLLTFADFCEA